MPEEYRDTYTNEDFEINIYETMEDWTLDRNPIYTNNFDATGEMVIEESFVETLPYYYMDISTPDNVLSNWVYKGFSVVLPTIKLEGNVNRVMRAIKLTESKKFIGDWKFVSEPFSNNDKAENYIGFTVSKDFMVTTTVMADDGELITRSFEVCSNSDDVISFSMRNTCSIAPIIWPIDKDDDSAMEISDTLTGNSYLFARE